jgi:ferritin
MLAAQCEEDFMIKPAIADAINKQIQHEQNNAQVYASIQYYFENLNLHGLAAWMAKQAGDERLHAEKLIAHLLARSGKVALGALPAPPAEFASPLEAAKSTLELERGTTAAIYRLVELAQKEKDYALAILLQWFITEQVEEEQSAEELASQMELFHKSAGQLYMLDHHWGKRAQKE